MTDRGLRHKVNHIVVILILMEDAMQNWVDFKTLKEAVTMEMILSHYSIEIRKVNATYMRGNCPLPTHTSDSSPNTFGVHTQKNAWACQSSSCVAARDGRKGGNILDFVAVMESCSIRDAALKIQDYFSVTASNERPEGYVRAKDRGEAEKKLVQEKKSVAADTVQQGTEKLQQDTPDEDDKEGNPPLEFALKSIDHEHPYLRKRGIRHETAEYFGIGFFFGKGSMKDRLVIPIHNGVGELVAYVGRAIDDETQPRYKLPNGFKKSLVLFNLHRAIQITESRGVVIVEEYFDSFKVHQAGIPCVVALMGSTLTKQQEQLLLENFDTAIVLLDGDEVGRYAADEIASRLTRKMFVRVVDVPDGKQPDQLSSVKIRQLLDFLKLQNGGDSSE